jgi:uncharacterized RDD family membrane protein YckC
MSYIDIQTTQNIHLEYEAASIGERLVAAILDRVLWICWVIAWFTFLSSLHWNSVWLIVIIGAPILFYYLLCELLFNGQSVGKRIMSIRVAKTDGTVPSFGDYFLRWVFRLIDNGGVAVLCMMFTAKCQRLGDLAAKTCVVRTRNKAKLVAVSATKLDYQVVFDTATLLTDRDVALIARIISNPATVRNNTGLNKLAGKVKEITQTQSDANDYTYLQTILADYSHLTGKL